MSFNSSKIVHNTQNIELNKENLWIWPQKSSTEFPERLTYLPEHFTEFPEHLTHSYISPIWVINTDSKETDKIEIGNFTKFSIFGALTFSFVFNFGMFIYHVLKSRKIVKNDTKVVRRWLKISFSAGKSWSFIKDVIYQGGRGDCQNIRVFFIL